MDGGTRRLLGEDSLQPGSRPPRRGDVLALRPSHGAILFRPSAQRPCIPWWALATAPTFIPAGRLHGHRQLSTRHPTLRLPCRKLAPTANNRLRSQPRLEPQAHPPTPFLPGTPISHTDGAGRASGPAPRRPQLLPSAGQLCCDG